MGRQAGSLSALLYESHGRSVADLTNLLRDAFLADRSILAGVTGTSTTTRAAEQAPLNSMNA